MDWLDQGEILVWFVSLIITDTKQPVVKTK
jgi:hypothetical protein